jgi:OPA family glycerol-3-phosphate transporter-like MFS transporter
MDHSPEFRKRRSRNWLTLGFTYSAMYMGRYNLSLANPFLSKAFGWDKAQVGAIISPALLVYGISAMFNGPICDKIGGRKSMLIGATGALIFNFLFGLGGYMGFLGKGSLLLAYFATVWSFNSYFQSFSALALIKVNAGWFHISERGIFSAVFGTMIQGGRFLIFAVGGTIVALMPWQWVFFVPSAIIAIMVTLVYFSVQNSPEDCGLNPLDVQDASSGDSEMVTLKYVFKKVFTNPVTITIAAAEFCTGFVRHGFEQWFPRYMTEAQHLPFDSVVFQGNAIGIVGAGVVGAFTAGILSDKVFKAKRTPVAFLGYCLQIISLGVIWLVPNYVMVIAAFVLNSFAISIVHSMLSGTASMDFGGKKAAGTAAGLFDGMQYIGGSFVGVGLGWLMDRYGWGVWGPSMMVFAIIGAVLMLFVWNARPQSRSAHP